MKTGFGAREQGAYKVRQILEELARLEGAGLKETTFDKVGPWLHNGFHNGVFISNGGLVSEDSGDLKIIYAVGKMLKQEGDCFSEKAYVRRDGRVVDILRIAGIREDDLLNIQFRIVDERMRKVIGSIGREFFGNLKGPQPIYLYSGQMRDEAGLGDPIRKVLGYVFE